MSKPIVWFLVGLAAVALLAGVVALVQPATAPGIAVMSPEEQRKFNEEFEAAMRRECMITAKAAAAREGRTGAEVDQIADKRCTCAIEVVRPMPVAEKATLHTDQDKLKSVLAEIVKRCGQ